jgi:sugar lactone lactonase YvrE
MAADWILNGLEGPRTSPILSVGLGQVSAVEVDRNGDVLVLHRGSRVWDYSSFGFDNVFKQKEKGPIQEPVILHLSSNGQILHKWGENMFYMPHGLTIDPSGNIWITDVAMHQVFKFSPGNHKEPVLKLGVPFEPGSDNRHFCKPAAVAVDHDGYFYIADGYCNHRIIKYSSSGGILQIMDKPVDGMSFRVPHSLTLLNGDTQLMVADRENGRVVIMKTSDLSQIVSVIKSSGFGDAVFAVAAPQVSNPAGYVYAVNFVREGQSGEGLTVKLNGGEIHQTWLPTKDGKKISFGMAHDIATSDDGQNVYVAEVNPHRIWKFVHHIENKFVGVVRNRTIGLNDPGSNDTATLNDSSVRVQDETNMPNDNFGDGLHDDKNVLPGVKDKQNTQSLDETPTTAFKEDEDDEEYICPSSVPPEECSTSAASSLVPSSTVRIAQVSLQAVQTPADENPPTSVKTPPTSAETSKSPTISHSTTGRPLPHEDSDNYDCPSPIPPEGCTTEGPVKATPCASASECFALFVRSHLNLILATSGLVALATIIVLVVLVLLCRRYYGCTRWRVRRGLSERAKQAKENIHSLIGPSHKGFVKVRTFDTDSEGEEDIVFQRI